MMDAISATIPRKASISSGTAYRRSHTKPIAVINVCRKPSNNVAQTNRNFPIIKLNRKLNLEIDSFVSLSTNWDGYGAIPVFNQVALNTKILLVKLGAERVVSVSDIFPNPHGTITIEWEKTESLKMSLEIGINNYSYFVTYAEPETKIGENVLDDYGLIAQSIDKLFAVHKTRYFLV